MLALFRGEDAVSSVISVILMVAVTVILAAVIAVFVLDVAESTGSEYPTADFSAQQNNETSVDGNGFTNEYKTVTVVHEGGDTIAEDRLYVTVDGETAYGYRQGTSKLWIAQLWNESGEVSSGMSIRIISATNAMDDEDFSSGIYEYDSKENEGGLGLTPQDTSDGGGEGEEFDFNTGLRTGEVVRVAWRSDGGTESVTLFEYEVK